MDMNHIAKIVTLKEALKKQVSIAQVKEVLRIVNAMTSGELYKLMRKI